MSFGVTHDPGVIAATELLLDPVWGGRYADFSAVALDAVGTGGACEVFHGGGVTVALIGSMENPGARTIGPGTAQRIATIRYVPLDEAASGMRSGLDLVSCLIPAAGSPPVALSITCASETRVPPRPAGSEILLVDRNCQQRGLCNADERLDISDPVALLSYLFTGGAALPCPEACNCNGDGSLDISDAICFLSHLFLGGSPPTPRFALCE